jgi:hypothetical protein
MAGSLPAQLRVTDERLSEANGEEGCSQMRHGWNAARTKVGCLTGWPTKAPLVRRARTPGLLSRPTALARTGYRVPGGAGIIRADVAHALGRQVGGATVRDP